ncbi:hypothetical protein DAPPUDRAFT_120020 [Daphnia pulex]|uniref:Uncharacterized protein n=1 Tax=Daphnia pulex TaxID=6669 RepID=E9I035_DAPPU|nr:hypothetical protein DAPPUDRAFT_120020 [Daphnia pulex]|eukprot:EFX62645.1 hypothetical protein DAPPUDRAFT_120020 [Daphnia pulex]
MPSKTVGGRGSTSEALRPGADGDGKLSSESLGAGLTFSSGGNDEDKKNELDGEDERDDEDPVAPESKDDHDGDDSSFDDEPPSVLGIVETSSPKRELSLSSPLMALK